MKAIHVAVLLLSVNISFAQTLTIDEARIFREKIRNGDISYVQREIVDTGLINASYKTASNDHTPLSIAIRYGKEDIVELLLNNRASVDDVDLMVSAINEGNMSIVKLLLAAGFNVKAIAERDGDSLLHIASSYDDTEMIMLFIQTGLPLNAQNDLGYTPLHYSAPLGKVEATKILLTHGADPNVVDKSGNTALKDASEEGSLGAVMALLEFGADPNIKNENGWTALHSAAALGHSDIIKTLLEYGETNIDPLNSEGMTPLSRAAYEGHINAVKTLLGYGADQNIRAESGYIAINYAAEKNKTNQAQCYELIEVLHKNGADLSILREELTNILSVSIVNAKGKAILQILDEMDGNSLEKADLLQGLLDNVEKDSNSGFGSFITDNDYCNHEGLTHWQWD